MASFPLEASPKPRSSSAKAKGQLSRRRSMEQCQCSSRSCSTAQSWCPQRLPGEGRGRTQDGEQELTLAVAVEAPIPAPWPGFQTWGGGSRSPFKPDGPQPHPAETESQSRRTVPPTRSAAAPWTLLHECASSSTLRRGGGELQGTFAFLDGPDTEGPSGKCEAAPPGHRSRCITVSKLLSPPLREPCWRRTRHPLRLRSPQEPVLCISTSLYRGSLDLECWFSN